MALVNPLVIDVLQQTQTATLEQSVVTTSGAGKAYQSVAQSTALAVQDATDALRNVSTMATTAAGVALAQILATGQVELYQPALDSAQSIMTNAIEDFGNIGKAAGEILSTFPSGHHI
jgi:hypothetical protein